MKKTPLIFCLFIFLTSCTTGFIQVFNTAAVNLQTKDKFFVFENDTLKVTYSFWTNKGVMSFSVYNKLEKPIYIDWKNSSFIYNDNKLNYWIDEQQTKMERYYGGYFYNGPLITPGFTINEGIQRTASTTLKPERITFIPPKSKYDRFQFFLMPVDFYPINVHANKSIVPRNDNPKRNSSVYNEDFSFNNSPLKFRNYLAVSFSENSQQYFFIDNKFYLTSVKEMEYKHFTGKLINDADEFIGINPIYEFPFQDATSFYIKIDNRKSIEWRLEDVLED